MKAVVAAQTEMRRKLDSIDENALPVAEEALAVADRVIATMPPSTLPEENVDAGTNVEKETPSIIVVILPDAIPSEAETLPAPPDEEEEKPT